MRVFPLKARGSYAQNPAPKPRDRALLLLTLNKEGEQSGGRLERKRAVKSEQRRS